MRNKAVDNYPHGLKFALEREWSKVSKSEKKMCHEAVNTYPSVIQFVPECFMTQEMFDKAVNQLIDVFFVCVFLLLCISFYS